MLNLFQQGQMGRRVIPIRDPFFANVKHLLHFNGADASTTFTDQIGTTWTASGNAQIDTAESRFGGASGLFDGTGDYVTATYNTTNDDWWTTDYTIEMWVRAASWATWAYNLGAGDHPVAVGNSNVANTTNFWSFGPTTTGAVRMYYFNGVAQFGALSSGTLSTNAWHHIAMTVTSGTIKLWLNGVGDTSIAIAGTPQSSAATTFQIGQANNRSLTGWIDDLRITKGTARYSANFTPSGPFPNS